MLLSDTFFEGQSNLWSNFFFVLDWVMAQFITIFSNQNLYRTSGVLRTGHGAAEMLRKSTSWVDPKERGAAAIGGLVYSDSYF